MFPLKFGSEVKTVTKIVADEFTPLHYEIIAQVQYEAGNLVFPNARWASIFLGVGEEKAVFCICDQNNRVFALEAINERNYGAWEKFFSQTCRGFLTKYHDVITM